MVCKSFIWNLTVGLDGLIHHLSPLPVFRDQKISIEEQLELARHYGPLHKHATTPVPRQPGLEEVHGTFSPLHRSAAVVLAEPTRPAQLSTLMAPAGPIPARSLR